MKRFNVVASILCLSAVCLVGCGEEEKEGKLNITTPDAKTTITTEHDVKHTDSPAPLQS